MKETRVELLTKIRGFAILFIVLYHYALEVTEFRIRPHIGSFSSNIESLDFFRMHSVVSFLANSVLVFFSIGWQYVGVFLILSGFGLTYSRLTKKDNSSFLLRRFSRLFPLWQYAIIFAFIINFAGLSLFPNLLVSIPTLNLINYFRLLFTPIFIDFDFTYISNVNPSLWFIILILQFYIAYDFLFLALEKLKVKKFLIYSIAATILYRIIIIYVFNQEPGSIMQFDGRNSTLFNFLPARLAEFSIGMSIAYLFVKNKVNVFKEINISNFFIAIAIWFFGIIATWSLFGWIFSDILLSFGLFVTTYFAISKIRNIFTLNILESLGNNSFLIYLFHNQPITQILVPLAYILSHYSNGIFIILSMFIVLAVITIGISLGIDKFKKKRKTN